MPAKFIVRRRLSFYLSLCVFGAVILLSAAITFLCTRLLIYASQFYCAQFCDCSSLISTGRVAIINTFNNSKPITESTTKSAKIGASHDGKSSFSIFVNVTIKTAEKKAPTGFRCDAVRGRRILINYAEIMYQRSQQKNCESGLAHGFDICIQFNRSSIDEFFQEANHEILSRYILAGYAVWKPFIIYKTLLAAEEEDVVVYTDSGSLFTGTPERLICLMEERRQDFVVFSSGLVEKAYSKPDALVALGCLTKNCSLSMQRMTGMVMARKSLKSLVVLSSWLAYNQDERIVDEANRNEFQNGLAFDGDAKAVAYVANRHDQTVLSIVSKKFSLPEWPDPSQFGESGWNARLRRRKEFESIRETIITFTRDKS